MREVPEVQIPACSDIQALAPAFRPSLQFNFNSTTGLSLITPLGEALSILQATPGRRKFVSLTFHCSGLPLFT